MQTATGISSPTASEDTIMGNKRAARMQERLVPRLLLGAILSASCILPAGQAWGDEKQECFDAHELGLKLKREGKLRAARDAFARCTRETCPGLVRTDCTDILGKLVASQPTIVVGARDSDGKELTSVAVFIDGVRATDRLDGRPIEIDPGERAMRYESADGSVITETMLVRQGEKERLISIRFASKAPVPATAAPSASAATPAAPAAPPKPGGMRRTLGYAFAALGVIGAGGFAYFGLTGLGKEKDLQACEPRCSQSDVDGLKTRYLMADISAGIGVLGLGLATWMFLSTPSPSTDKAAASARVQANVVPGGGFFGVAGAF
jgi:hypothetical protein